MKLTAKQFKDFYDQYAHHLDAGHIEVHDEIIEIDGVEIDDFDPAEHPPETIISVSGGYFCSFTDETDHLDGKTFEVLCRKWLKNQGLMQFSVSVPLEKIEKFREACKALGIACP